MKKLHALLIALFFTTWVAAQVANTINYQAVARNNSGQALANQSIKVRLSILRGPNSLYSETRTVTTNTLGLFNVQIGSSGATTTTGDFNNIYWLNNTPAITLKVELDVNNSGVFTEMGNQTLASVPYAYAAKNSIDAVNLGGRYVDASITPNEGDVMKWSSTDNAWKPAVVGQPAVTNLYCPISAIAPNAQWTFIPSLNGNFSYTTITITKPALIVATATVVIGHTGTGQLANDIGFSPAYQLTSGQGGVITLFSPGNYPAAQISTTKTPFSCAGSVTLTTPGTYKIGFVVRNNSNPAITLNSNDFLSGYVMIYQ